MDQELADENSFSLEHITEWIHAPEHGRIMCGGVGNNVLFAGTDQGFILRFGILEEKLTALRCPVDEPIQNLHVDPSGRHIFISTTMATSYYIFKADLNSRFIPIKKIGRNHIHAVAWNKKAVQEWLRLVRDPSRDSQGTYSTLLGTSSGHLYEISISDQAIKRCRLLWQVPGAGSVAATSLRRLTSYMPSPNPGSSEFSIQGIVMERIQTKEKNQYFIAVATTSRLYHFAGGPSLDVVFAVSKSEGQDLKASKWKYHELPAKSLAHSELHLTYASYPQSSPNGLVWLSEPGIFHGRLTLDDFRSYPDGKDNKFFYPSGLAKYPKGEEKGATTGKAAKLLTGKNPEDFNIPVSMGCTRFHYLLLFADRLSCLHTLSQTVSYTYTLSQRDIGQIGFFKLIATDRCQGTHWAFCERGVFEITVQDEGRDAWLLLARSGRFKEALDCVGSNKHRRDQIIAAYAEDLNSKGQYISAAKHYAKVPHIFKFSEVAVKFSTNQTQDALIEYLKTRLINTPPQNLTQTTMMATWLLQLYLQRISALRLRTDTEAKMEKGTTRPAASASSHGTEAQSLDIKTYLQAESSQEKNLRKELMEFLEDFDDCLDKSTTFRLISNLGFLDLLEMYAEKKNARQWLVYHYLTRKRFRRALLVIAKYVTYHEKAKRRVSFEADIFYKNVATLLQHEPRKTVDILIKAGDLVNPRVLIPAFTQYISWLNNSPIVISPPMSAKSKDTKVQSKLGQNYKGTSLKSNHAIRYFMSVILEGKNRDPQVHNFLARLCVQDPNSSHLKQLLEEGPKPPLFDYEMAIRLCDDLCKQRQIVDIHRAYGQLSAATKSAITFDLKLAHELLTLLSKQPNPECLAEIRGLWVSFVENAIKQDGTEESVAKILELTSSSTVLSFKDLLDLIPPTISMKTIKRSLSQIFQNRLSDVKRTQSQLDMVTSEAKRISFESQKSVAGQGRIYNDRHSACELSGLPLLRGSREWIGFNCGHEFLMRALINHIKTHTEFHPDTMLKGCYRRLVLSNPKLSNIFKGIEEEKDERRKKIKIQMGLSSIFPSEWRQIARCECVLCGTAMVESALDPLVSPDEEQSKEWAVTSPSTIMPLPRAS
ncbi:hypothetical protein AAMO2058_000508000 [Amorphochlora amoebiformis]|uniref:Pep3/Vps18 beta-propeller domain-containing protein n=1 Tax=Amorphochlora amoebiformis TaxID=1561963 RepID=A0A6T6XX77_9EUKA|mmetsp:Transcript_32608/g.52521  ORF Transcript_32608/g.52521 Transcript_32608/m.52521 type:complete len:1104 (+) Transcript_32608:48-3359(+)